ncbi:MAG: FAD-dependent oxidoreductase [Bacteroidetes bacterium]|nr:FAD-dependent oxidoreductase [Bacteroidota bacterium]
MMMKESKLTSDILVAGGGMAGVACALAAARCGAKVILCQDRPVLGGNASSEIRMHVVGADCSGGRGAALETEAREGGIIEEIRLKNAVHNPQRSPSVFDLILYDTCRCEPNITLLMNTTVVDSVVENRSITYVTAENRSSEQRFILSSNIFIDCTGDGALGVLAGSQFREGREAASEFSESFADKLSDAKRLGSTLLFQARRHEKPMPFTAPSWARKFTEKDLRLRPHANTSVAVDTGLEYGYWWVEWGGDLDTIKDNEIIQNELIAIMMGVWDHVKNDGDHGAENWALEWLGFLPGKRESRRFVGKSMLTQNDIMLSRSFDDAIAYGGWPIDTHPPGGVDAVDQEPCTQHRVPELYDIPLSACISDTVKNLMFAGRNISATHLAFASTRVMATVAAVGQGVGTAAAFAVKAGQRPHELLEKPEQVTAVQQRLLRDDAYLIGVLNNDPKDLARESVVSASSEQSDGQAINITSGQTRAIHGYGGIKSDRAATGTHRWMSDPNQSLPQWIGLCWNESVAIGRIELIFDTGLHRVLTLSYSDEYTAKMHWGRPQEETVKDYSIEYLVENRWNSLVKETGNYQRRRVHILDNPVTASAVRITVKETNGLDHARICEIRVYEK